MLLTFDLNPASVQIHDTMHRCETQPGPLFLRREKWKKYLVEVLLRNTLPTVLKRNFDDVALAAAGINLAAIRRDRQLSSPRHCIKCICRHVPEDLPELILIDQGRKCPGCQRCDDFDLGTCSCFMLN